VSGLSGFDWASLDLATLKAHWVDAAMAALLVVSVFTGLARGLMFELLSLLGWLAAYVAAQWAAPLLAKHLPIGVPGSAINQLAAFVTAFFVALVLWSIVTRLARLIIRASPLSPIDRLFGAVFGALRGVVVLLVVATVVGLTPARRSAPWRASQGAVWLNEALQAVRPLLPAELSRHLPA